MRSQKPPVTYKAISVYMKEKHSINITAPAIHNFIKVRKRRGDLYMMPPENRPADIERRSDPTIKEKIIGLASPTLKRPVDDESVAPPPPSIPGKVAILPDDCEANTATKPLQLKIITPRRLKT